MTQKMTKLAAKVYDALVEDVRANLTPELLKPEFRESPFPTGHCYVAVESIYHLAGGPESGLKPMRLRMPDGVVHWWLEDTDGQIIDPTHDQFEETVPYAQGRSGGFLTATPSKRAQEVMKRVQGAVKTAQSMLVVYVEGGNAVWAFGHLPWVFDRENNTLYMSDWGALHKPILRHLKQQVEHGVDLRPGNLVPGATSIDGQWEFVEEGSGMYHSLDANEWAAITEFSKSEAEWHKNWLAENEEDDGRPTHSSSFKLAQEVVVIDPPAEWDFHGGGYPFVYLVNEQVLYVMPAHGYHIDMFRQMPPEHRALVRGYLQDDTKDAFVAGRISLDYPGAPDGDVDIYGQLLPSPSDKSYYKDILQPLVDEHWGTTIPVVMADHYGKIAAFDVPIENPVNYEFVPLSPAETTPWDTLSIRDKEWWRRKAKKLNNYARRGKIMPQELHALYTRYQGFCAYCGGEGATSWDHVIPLAQGGRNQIDNLLPCHRECNGQLNDWDQSLMPTKQPPKPPGYWGFEPAEAAVNWSFPDRIQNYGGFAFMYHEGELYVTHNGHHPSLMRKYLNDNRAGAREFREQIMAGQTVFGWVDGDEIAFVSGNAPDSMGKDADPQLKAEAYEVVKGYVQEQKTAGTQPVELMVSEGDRFRYLDYLKRLERFAWVYFDGTLYVGGRHPDIMREMRFEGLDFRENAMYGWHDPMGAHSRDTLEFITDTGEQNEALKPEVEAFFEQYPPQTILAYLKDGTKLSMAFSPEQWTQVKEWTGELYHVTDESKLEQIMQEGIRPASELGKSRDYGFFAPRPNHVYLFADLAHAQESGRYMNAYEFEEDLDEQDQYKRPVVLRINTRYLDPNKFKADEDFAWDWANVVGDGEDLAETVEEQYGLPPMPRGTHGVGYNGLGQWADRVELDTPEITMDSYMNNNSVAYEGGIPPEAILGVVAPSPNVHPRMLSANAMKVMRVKTPRTKLRGVYGMPFSYVPSLGMIFLADSHTFHTRMWQRIPAEYRQTIAIERSTMVNGHIVPVKGDHLGGVQFYLETRKNADDSTLSAIQNLLAPYVAQIEFEEEEYVEETKPGDQDQLSLLGKIAAIPNYAGSFIYFGDTKELLMDIKSKYVTHPRLLRQYADSIEFEFSVSPGEYLSARERITQLGLADRPQVWGQFSLDPWRVEGLRTDENTSMVNIVQELEDEAREAAKKALLDAMPEGWQPGRWDDALPVSTTAGWGKTAADWAWLMNDIEYKAQEIAARHNWKLNIKWEGAVNAGIVYWESVPDALFNNGVAAPDQIASVDIKMAPITNKISYYVALHELGHMEFTSQFGRQGEPLGFGNSVEEEMWAMHWAIENGAGVIDRETMQQASKYVNTYFEPSILFTGITRDSPALPYVWLADRKFEPLMSKIAGTTMYRVTPTKFRERIIEQGLEGLPDYSGQGEEEHRVYMFQDLEAARLFARQYRNYHNSDIWRITLPTDVNLMHDPRAYPTINEETGVPEYWKPTPLYGLIDIPPENVELVDEMPAKNALVEEMRRHANVDDWEMVWAVDVTQYDHLAGQVAFVVYDDLLVAAEGAGHNDIKRWVRQNMYVYSREELNGFTRQTDGQRMVSSFEHGQRTEDVYPGITDAVYRLALINEADIADFDNIRGLSKTVDTDELYNDVNREIIHNTEVIHNIWIYNGNTKKLYYGPLDRTVEKQMGSWKWNHTELMRIHAVELRAEENRMKSIYGWWARHDYDGSIRPIIHSDSFSNPKLKQLRQEAFNAAEAAIPSQVRPIHESSAAEVQWIDTSGSSHHGLGYPWFYDTRTDQLFVGTTQAYHANMLRRWGINRQDYMGTDDGAGSEMPPIIGGRWITGTRNHPLIVFDRNFYPPETIAEIERRVKAVAPQLEEMDKGKTAASGITVTYVPMRGPEDIFAEGSSRIPWVYRIAQRQLYVGDVDSLHKPLLKHINSRAEHAQDVRATNLMAGRIYVDGTGFRAGTGIYVEFTERDEVEQALQHYLTSKTATTKLNIQFDVTVEGVTAYVDGAYAGRLDVAVDSIMLGEPMILDINVLPEYHRQGVATEMIEAYRGMYGQLDHDWGNMSDEGRAWAEKVGGKTSSVSFRIDHTGGKDDVRGWTTIRAWSEDQIIGTLAVLNGQIAGINVQPDYQQQGVATEMLEYARNLLGSVTHDWDDMSDEGWEWATRVGGNRWGEMPAIGSHWAWHNDQFQNTLTVKRLDPRNEVVVIEGMMGHEVEIGLSDWLQYINDGMLKQANALKQSDTMSYNKRALNKEDRPPYDIRWIEMSDGKVFMDSGYLYGSHPQMFRAMCKPEGYTKYDMVEIGMGEDAFTRKYDEGGNFTWYLDNVDTYGQQTKNAAASLPSLDEIWRWRVPFYALPDETYALGMPGQPHDDIVFDVPDEMENAGQYQGHVIFHPEWGEAIAEPEWMQEYGEYNKGQAMMTRILQEARAIWDANGPDVASKSLHWSSNADNTRTAYRDMWDHEPGVWYHVTSRANLERITSAGLQPVLDSDASPNFSHDYDQQMVYLFGSFSTASNWFRAEDMFGEDVMLLRVRVDDSLVSRDPEFTDHEGDVEAVQYEGTIPPAQIEVRVPSDNAEGWDTEQWQPLGPSNPGVGDNTHTSTVMYYHVTPSGAREQIEQYGLLPFPEEGFDPNELGVYAWTSLSSARNAVRDYESQREVPHDIWAVNADGLVWHLDPLTSGMYTSDEVEPDRLTLVEPATWDEHMAHTHSNDTILSRWPLALPSATVRGVSSPSTEPLQSQGLTHAREYAYASTNAHRPLNVKHQGVSTLGETNPFPLEQANHTSTLTRERYTHLAAGIDHDGMGEGFMYHNHELYVGGTHKSLIRRVGEQWEDWGEFRDAPLDLGWVYHGKPKAMSYDNSMMVNTTPEYRDEMLRAMEQWLSNKGAWGNTTSLVEQDPHQGAYLGYPLPHTGTPISPTDTTLDIPDTQDISLTSTLSENEPLRFLGHQSAIQLREGWVEGDWHHLEDVYTPQPFIYQSNTLWLGNDDAPTHPNVVRKYGLDREKSMLPGWVYHESKQIAFQSWEEHVDRSLIEEAMPLLLASLPDGYQRINLLRVGASEWQVIEIVEEALPYQDDPLHWNDQRPLAFSIPLKMIWYGPEGRHHGQLLNALRMQGIGRKDVSFMGVWVDDGMAHYQGNPPDALEALYRHFGMEPPVEPPGEWKVGAYDSLQWASTPELDVQHIPTAKSPGAYMHWRIPILYWFDTNTLYYGDPDGTHKTMFKALKLQYEHASASSTDFAGGWYSEDEYKFFGHELSPPPEHVVEYLEAIGLHPSDPFADVYGASAWTIHLVDNKPYEKEGSDWLWASFRFPVFYVPERRIMFVGTQPGSHHVPLMKAMKASVPFQAYTTPTYREHLKWDFLDNGKPGRGDLAIGAVPMGRDAVKKAWEMLHPAKPEPADQLSLFGASEPPVDPPGAWKSDLAWEKEAGLPKFLRWSLMEDGTVISGNFQDHGLLRDHEGIPYTVVELARGEWYLWKEDGVVIAAIFDEPKMSLTAEQVLSFLKLHLPPFSEMEWKKRVGSGFESGTLKVAALAPDWMEDQDLWRAFAFVDGTLWWGFAHTRILEYFRAQGVIPSKLDLGWDTEGSDPYAMSYDQSGFIITDPEYRDAMLEEAVRQRATTKNVIPSGGKVAALFGAKSEIIEVDTEGIVYQDWIDPEIGARRRPMFYQPWDGNVYVGAFSGLHGQIAKKLGWDKTWWDAALRGMIIDNVVIWSGGTYSGVPDAVNAQVEEWYGETQPDKVAASGIEVVVVPVKNTSLISHRTQALFVDSLNNVVYIGGAGGSHNVLMKGIQYMHNNDWLNSNPFENEENKMEKAWVSMLSEIDWMRDNEMNDWKLNFHGNVTFTNETTLPPEARDEIAAAVEPHILSEHKVATRLEEGFTAQGADLAFDPFSNRPNAKGLRGEDYGLDPRETFVYVDGVLFWGDRIHPRMLSQIMSEHFFISKPKIEQVKQFLAEHEVAFGRVMWEGQFLWYMGDTPQWSEDTTISFNSRDFGSSDPLVIEKALAEIRKIRPDAKYEPKDW